MSSKKRSTTSRWRFLRAYQITFQILAKYFFLFFIRKLISEKRSHGIMMRAHQKTSQTIVKNIILLKGLYIKIGQTLSIMTNFLPSSFTKDLEQLQDAVPPHPYEDIEARFIAEFQKSPHEVFGVFEREPIAAASLAQVHIAKLKDGTKLAVKLQYPDIDKIVHSDLKTIKRIFGILDFIFPTYGLKEVYFECAKMISEELDFSFEGKNLEKIKNNFHNHPEYVFPKIYWEYSSSKILTLEFVEGIKVSHIDKLTEASVDPHKIATQLIHFYCQQIFIDGVYHADPHPGNIIIQAGDPPRIAMVDYGATAQISSQMKEGITLFVEGLLKKDTRILSSAMRQMGFIAKEENEETFDKIVEYFYSKIKGIKIDNFREINIANFQHLNDILELKKMDISFKELTSTFHVPKDWILLERTLLLMMGLVAHLDPRLNPMDIVLPYVEEFVLGKDKKLTDLILESAKELFLAYINLPTDIRKTLKMIQEGRVVIKNKEAHENTHKIYSAIHQLIYTLLLIFCVTFGYNFYQQGNTEWFQTTKYLSGLFGVLLVWNIIKNRK